MDLKYITGPITKATAGGLSAVISTPKIDSDGESVDPTGMTNRDEWLTNPLVYWAHEWVYNPAAEPVGKGERLDLFRDRIESDAVYAPTPKAQNVRALVSGGFVRKTSIGFDPMEMADIKGVPTHTKWALREWSIVPMPANTEATITGVKSALRWLADEGLTETTDELGSNVVLVKIDPAALVDALSALEDLNLGSLEVEDQTGEPDVVLADKGRRIAIIRRRRVAVLH